MSSVLFVYSIIVSAFANVSFMTTRRLTDTFVYCC